MMKIFLGDNLRLPLDFVTQTQAILAKRGVGKSYTASVEAEEMLKAGQQVVIIDPTGAWWGLKSSADGKHPGFSIVVFGGEHADVPLEESAGEIVASAIVEHRFSAILDLSLLRKGQISRFMAPFLETLYRLNREAMHLIVDEADAIAPQRPFNEEARMLGAMEDVVRRGRRRGIGCTLISQRPQVLNKNVLTQCEILCALRLIHPKDINAIEEWVNVHGDPDRAKAMIVSLPSLPIGTAWFWAPGWGDIFQRVKIRKRETFDSSATPEVGRTATKPAVLAPVDIERLGTQIQATVNRVKENDPQALKRKIAELEKRQTTPEVDRGVIDRAVKKALAEQAREYQGRIRALEVFAADSTKIMRSIRDHADKLLGGSSEAMERVNAVLPVQVDHRPPEQHHSIKQNAPSRPKVPQGEKLRAGAERMLAALVQWHPQGMHEGQMRSHAGMKKSGTFSTYMSDLRTRGMLEQREGMLFATQDGIDYFGGNVPAAPSTTEEVLAVWEPKLRDGARRILRILVSVKGKPLPLDELATAADMTRSGTFSTYLSDLRTAKLIITGGGEARANKDTLFL